MIARAYIGVMVVGFVWVHVAGYVASFFDQLELQYIASFHKAMKFMTHHWIYRQYAGAATLSVAYLARVKSTYSTGATADDTAGTKRDEL